VVERKHGFPWFAKSTGAARRLTDTKLNRDVALKVLPEIYTRDATAWPASPAKGR